MMLRMIKLARHPVEIVRRVATSARRVGDALGAKLLDHPFEISRIDASAASLWPANQEEAEPPRWRPDAWQPRTARSDHRVRIRPDRQPRRPWLPRRPRHAS